VLVLMLQTWLVNALVAAPEKTACLPCFRTVHSAKRSIFEDTTRDLRCAEPRSQLTFVTAQISGSTCPLTVSCSRHAQRPRATRHCKTTLKTFLIHFNAGTEMFILVYQLFVQIRVRLQMPLLITIVSHYHDCSVYLFTKFLKQRQ
jgi:hypothetical protein